MYSYMLKHTYLLYISIANNNDDKLYRYCGYHLSVQKLMLSFWTREHITYCNCGALSYTHTHCPCFHCNGKAVSRSTKYRHWQRVNTERFEAISLHPPTSSCGLNQGVDLQMEGRGDVRRA